MGDRFDHHFTPESLQKIKARALRFCSDVKNDMERLVVPEESYIMGEKMISAETTLTPFPSMIEDMLALVSVRIKERSVDEIDI